MKRQSNASFLPQMKKFKETTESEDDSPGPLCFETKKQIYKKNSNEFQRKTKTESPTKLTAKLNLNGLNEVEVVVGYNKKLVDAFRLVYGSIYNNEKKAWIFPLEKYEELQELFDYYDVILENKLSAKDLKLKKIVVIKESKHGDFELKFPFDMLKDTIKQCGALFDASRRKWCIKFSSKHEFIAALEQENVKYHIVEFPKEDPSQISIVFAHMNNDDEFTVKSKPFSRVAIKIFEQAGGKFDPKEKSYRFPCDSKKDLITRLYAFKCENI